jgi:hypothetical protein
MRRCRVLADSRDARRSTSASSARATRAPSPVRR